VSPGAAVDNAAVSVKTRVAQLLPSLDGPTNLIREAWDRLSRLPGGTRLFSRFVGRAAPYTGTIAAEVTELAIGRSVVVLRDQRKVRNHLRCIHAIALANLAELTGNVALAYSLPDDARFIVAGMSIDYKKKARGTIRGVCDCPVPADASRREYVVPVSMLDEAGDEVAHATLRTLVGPKPTA
jgi:acyl-coenzyme A thioesterase PaaI-like protein